MAVHPQFGVERAVGDRGDAPLEVDMPQLRQHVGHQIVGHRTRRDDALERVDDR
ncbi:hypothetical protein SDC9_90752 [bioreactor metagenome]|uniref:Uncharacterized protein n=1 Tax=bioreactor metagenome TaxID=1076179 RepID=A0A645A2P5_9ZZZZ